MPDCTAPLRWRGILGAAMTSVPLRHGGQGGEADAPAMDAAPSSRDMKVMNGSLLVLLLLWSFPVTLVPALPPEKMLFCSVNIY